MRSAAKLRSLWRGNSLILNNNTVGSQSHFESPTWPTSGASRPCDLHSRCASNTHSVRRDSGTQTSVMRPLPPGMGRAGKEGGEGHTCSQAGQRQGGPHISWVPPTIACTDRLSTAWHPPRQIPNPPTWPQGTGGIVGRVSCRPQLSPLLFPDSPLEVGAAQLRRNCTCGAAGRVCASGIHLVCCKASTPLGIC